MNWMFGAGEVRGLLNDAVSIAMEGLVKDIRVLCDDAG